MTKTCAGSIWDSPSAFPDPPASARFDPQAGNRFIERPSLSRNHVAAGPWRLPRMPALAGELQPSTGPRQTSAAAIGKAQIPPGCGIPAPIRASALARTGRRTQLQDESVDIAGRTVAKCHKCMRIPSIYRRCRGAVTPLAEGVDQGRTMPRPLPAHSRN